DYYCQVYDSSATMLF
nr:immunoglobulin light chain junction region [Macaca mulatta]